MTAGWQTVERIQQGPIRVAIQAQGGTLALFKPAEANRLKRMALTDAGNLWLGVFLGKRFSDYATRLGYVVSAKWRQRKARDIGVVVPFVGFTPHGGGPPAPGWSSKNANSEKMLIAARGARATATATQTREAVVITIPTGHALRPEHMAAFRNVPSWEVERMGQEVAKSLARMLMSAQVTAKGDGLTMRGAQMPRSVATLGQRRVGGGERRVT
ncbi:MAG: hypothetical protein H0W48_00530 [Methylibium sp.]|nr:hypothetical protein [Methylibium sp.]